MLKNIICYELALVQLYVSLYIGLQTIVYMQ